MKRIRLTESRLRNIIRESIKSILRENEETFEDDNIIALAQYLHFDPEDIKERQDNFYEVSNGEQWYVFDSIEDAEDYVMSPGYDASGFMEDCWDSGESFFNWLQKNPNSAAYYNMEEIFPYMDEGYYDIVDWRAVAQTVLDVDGPQWFLAGYDGKEHELPNGAMGYRHN